MRDERTQCGITQREKGEQRQRDNTHCIGTQPISGHLAARTASDHNWTCYRHESSTQRRRMSLYASGREAKPQLLAYKRVNKTNTRRDVLKNDQDRSSLVKRQESKAKCHNSSPLVYLYLFHAGTDGGLKKLVVWYVYKYADDTVLPMEIFRNISDPHLVLRGKHWA